MGGCKYGRVEEKTDLCRTCAQGRDWGERSMRLLDAVIIGMGGGRRKAREGKKGQRSRFVAAESREEGRLGR